MTFDSLGSSQYSGILDLVYDIDKPMPIAPGLEQRLDAIWNEIEETQREVLEEDYCCVRGDYEQSMRGFVLWTRDNSWDLWSAGNAVAGILYDEIIDGDIDEVVAQAIATCIAHGASLADFADFDT